MTTFFEMFKIVLLFALLLLPGYILGKLRMIESCAMLSFSNILMYVAMPSLVILKLLEIDLKSIGVWEIVISVLLPVVVEVTMLIVMRSIYGDNGGKSRAVKFCAVFPNCGFLGIPLASVMWPEKPEIVLYISLFNVTSTFLLLTLGVYALSGDKKEINVKKVLVSPIFFAIILGVLCSVFNLGKQLPQLITYFSNLSSLTTPLAMIALGFELSNLHLLKMWKSAGIFISAFFKLCAPPILTMGVILVLNLIPGIRLNSSFANAMLVATGVSTAASAPAMAKKYGADSEYAAALTLSSTLLCVITMPLFYAVFDLVF